MPREIFAVQCSDRSGDHMYSVRLLHEFGVGDGYFNPRKVSELWSIARQNEVLFSDYTAGKVEPFLAILMNPASVWLEIFRITDDKPVGVAYISNVIPKFDAKGHFAVWDRIAGGREEIFWRIMEWMFEQYNLRRISAEAPVYQSGVIRFTKKLGFKAEGTKKDGVLHKGKWMPLILFGITVEDFQQLRKKELEAEVANG
jgi:RimJ/RimL family protein N-acetyltransferase